MSEPRDVERQDLEAALETRRELGPTFEMEVVDSFVDKIETAIGPASTRGSHSANATNGTAVSATSGRWC